MDSKNGDLVKNEVPDEKDSKCGWLGCKPKCLQCFAKPPWLLVCVMLLIFTQGFIINGIKNVNTSTLERRFQLTSGQVAWISASYDIGAGVFALLFGYLGTFVHKSRMIAGGSLVLGCGSLTMFLPHLMVGVYDVGASDSDLCDTTGNSSACVPGAAAGGGYIAVFVLGQLLNSVGGAAIYTLGIPLLDENVRRKDSAFYIGSAMSCSVLGPGVGFIVGGVFLQIYVDAFRVDMDDIDIAPGDPKWVGAWWIGFLLGGILMIILSLLMAAFPKELSTNKKYQAERDAEAYGVNERLEMMSETFGYKAKDVWILLKSLVKNATFMCVTIAGVLEYGMIIGFAVFLPKIIQFQFAQTPAMSAVYAGVIVIPAATFGHIIGGFVPKILDLRLKGLIIQGLVFNGIAWCLIFQFLIKCDIPKIAGISVPYENSTFDMDENNPDVFHPCNQNCSCTTISYDPVCGQNGVTYFTPCHAGCIVSNNSWDKEVFYNCSCIQMETDVDLQMPAATSGLCPETCDSLPLFLVLFFLLNLSTFIPATSGHASTMRCVPDKQRAFAYGVQSTVVRYLGNVPGPLLLGAIFDRSCWLWQEDCGERGSCWIYNPDDISQGIVVVGLAMKSLSFLSTLLALVLYKPPEPIVQEIEISNEGKTKDTKTAPDGLPPSTTISSDAPLASDEHGYAKKIDSNSSSTEYSNGGLRLDYEESTRM